MGYLQAAAAVAATAYGIIQGERGSRVQRQAGRRQAAAQDAALASARRQETDAAEASARANARQPDLSPFLLDDIYADRMGSNAAGYGRLKLSRNSLLGG